MITKCLSEMAGEVPIGSSVDPSDPRGKAVDFRPWRGRDERAIGEMRGKHRNLTPGQLTSRVLAHFVTQWCGHDFSAMSTPERLVALALAPAADVLTAWLHLRVAALGPEFSMTLVCPSCGHEMEYEIDLGTLEIRCPETLEDTAFDVPLDDGLLYGNKKVKSVTLGVIPWQGYEATTASGARDLADLQMRLLVSAVTRLDGQPGRLRVNDLDDMTKRDLAGLARGLDERVLGPDLSVDPDCPRCTGPVRAVLSWVYDGFFSAPSRGRTRASR